jgi:cobalt-zinc-cadmium efflux system outer membrane protein
MPLKVSVSLLILPFCAMAAPPQSGGQAHAVDELVRTAVERNRELLAVRQRVAEARGLFRQAGVRPASSLQLGGATGKPLGSPGKEEYSAGYSQPVELGGKRDKRLQVAGKGVGLAEAEFAERALRLATEIKLRYLDAVMDEARLAALDRLIETYRESQKLVEARVREGDAAPLDSQLLLVEVSRAEAQKRTVAGRIQVALSDLRRLCGFGASESLVLAGAARRDPNPAFALADLERQAAEQRPDLRAAKLEQERGAAEVDLTEAQARPDVTLSAQYALRNERFGDLYGSTASGQPAPLRDRDNILSFGVSIPILTRRSNLGNIEAAAARAVASRTLRQHLEASIPLEVEAAWQHWDAAAQSLDILDSGVLRQSQKNLDVIRQAYALGQLRLLDVLNEQRRLIDTQMAYIDAESDVRRGFIELERAVGGDLK